jgi:hypothetical protein
MKYFVVSIAPETMDAFNAGRLEGVRFSLSETQLLNARSGEDCTSGLAYVVDSEIPEEAIAQLANILFSVEEISEGEAEEITETGEFAEETEDEDKQ